MVYIGLKQKVPIKPQMYSYSCGPAIASTLLKMLDFNVSEKRILKEMGMQKNVLANDLDFPSSRIEEALYRFSNNQITILDHSIENTTDIRLELPKILNDGRIPYCSLKRWALGQDSEVSHWFIIVGIDENKIEVYDCNFLRRHTQPKYEILIGMFYNGLTAHPGYYVKRKFPNFYQNYINGEYKRKKGLFFVNASIKSAGV